MFCRGKLLVNRFVVVVVVLVFIAFGEYDNKIAAGLLKIFKS